MRLTGILSKVRVLSARLSRIWPWSLFGQANGTSVVTATLRWYRILSGSADGFATVVIIPLVNRFVVALANGAATVDTGITRWRLMNGSSVIVSQIVSRFIRGSIIIGVSAGAATPDSQLLTASQIIDSSSVAKTDSAGIAITGIF